MRFRSQRHVDRHEVGLGKQASQVDARRAQIPLGVRRQRLRIVVQHAHVESLGPMRDAAADPPDADQTKRRAVDVRTEHHVDRPASELSLAGEAVGLDDPSRGSRFNFRSRIVPSRSRATSR